MAEDGLAVFDLAVGDNEKVIIDGKMYNGGDDGYDDADDDDGGDRYDDHDHDDGEMAEDGLTVYSLAVGDNEKVKCLPDWQCQATKESICCSVSTTLNIPTQKLSRKAKCSFNPQTDYNPIKHHDHRR